MTIGYDIENLTDPERGRTYRGEVVTDHYGRKVPKHAHGTANLESYHASTSRITEAVMALYDRIVNPDLLVRRINLVACHVIREGDIPEEGPAQMDFFSDFAAEEKKREEEREALAREKRRQQAVIQIKKKYGKNAILKGMNLEEGATARDRNRQIGGHKA